MKPQRHTDAAFPSQRIICANDCASQSKPGPSSVFDLAASMASADPRSAALEASSGPRIALWSDGALHIEAAGGQIELTPPECMALLRYLGLFTAHPTMRTEGVSA